MGRGQQGGCGYVGNRKGEVGNRKSVLTLKGGTPKQSIQFFTRPRVRESLRIISHGLRLNITDCWYLVSGIFGR